MVWLPWPHSWSRRVYRSKRDCWREAGNCIWKALYICRFVLHLFPKQIELNKAKILFLIQNHCAYNSRLGTLQMKFKSFFQWDPKDIRKIPKWKEYFFHTLRYPLYKKFCFKRSFHWKILADQKDEKFLIVIFVCTCTHMVLSWVEGDLIRMTEGNIELYSPLLLDFLKAKTHENHC